MILAGSVVTTDWERDRLYAGVLAAKKKYLLLLIFENRLVKLLRSGRLMEYKDELKDVQQIEISILKTVTDLCDKHDIEYFIIGGTLLGAVRHRGFIPWDDDIDIGMNRNEYDRFISLMPEILPDDLFMQSPLTEKDDPFPYVKIRKTGTEFVEYCNRNKNMHRGIYLDVFPFDNVPDNETEYRHLFERVQRMAKLYSLRHVPDITIPPRNLTSYFKYITRRMIYYLMKLVPSEIITIKLETIMRSYNNKDTSSVACLFFPDFKTEHVSKSNLYPLKEYDFGDLKVKGPENYDIYLKTHYGNYMILPNQEKRIGHRPYILNTDSGK